MDFEITVDLNKIHKNNLPTEILLARDRHVKLDSIEVTRTDGTLIQPAMVVIGTQHNFFQIYFEDDLVMFLDVESLPLHGVNYLCINSLVDEGVYRIGLDYEDN